MPKVVGNVFWGNTVKPRANIPTQSSNVIITIGSRVSFRLCPAPFNGVHLTIRKSSGEYVRVPRELIDYTKLVLFRQPVYHPTLINKCKIISSL